MEYVVLFGVGYSYFYWIVGVLGNKNVCYGVLWGWIWVFGIGVFGGVWEFYGNDDFIVVECCFKYVGKEFFSG